MAASGEFASWILGSLSSGVVAVDQDGTVVLLNEGARRVLGCRDGAPGAGRPCREVFAQQPAVARLLHDALAGRSALSRAELVLDGAPGAAPGLGGTIGFTLSSVRDRHGRVRGAAMIFRDLTPFERSSEQERLRERLAALGQMAAGLAHEIRNPLAGMEVLAGLLRRRLPEGSEDRELVVELLGELRKLADTVTASLEFVRPLAIARGPVDAVELLENALSVATSRVPFEGAVDRAYADDLPPLSADADLLRVVVTNLIVNALEAMASGGPSARLALAVECRPAGESAAAIRVRTDGTTAVSDFPPHRASARVDAVERPGTDSSISGDSPFPPGGLSAGAASAGAAPEAAREIMLSVADSGPGIAPELKERIFYPFFTTKERGSGVGLALAQKIAASHGGALELDPDGAPGARFRLRLPVEPVEK